MKTSKAKSQAKSKRKYRPPQTKILYSCISEPNGVGKQIIRLSFDPDSLDSLQFLENPTRHPRFPGRTVFYFLNEYVDGPCVSCRDVDGQFRPLAGDDAAIDYLLGNID